VGVGCATPDIIRRSNMLKVITVCGFGLGSSMILRMSVEKVLKKHGIDGNVETCDITTASSVQCDVIFTSNEFYQELGNKVKVPVFKVNNFLKGDEIEEGFRTIKII